VLTDQRHRERGPDALARFLGPSVDQVFSISCDVQKYVKGEANALAGTVPRKPRVRLTKAELMVLAVR
jgi:hypothetical protein